MSLDSNISITPNCEGLVMSLSVPLQEVGFDPQTNEVDVTFTDMEAYNVHQDHFTDFLKSVLLQSTTNFTLCGSSTLIASLPVVALAACVHVSCLMFHCSWLTRVRVSCFVVHFTSACCSLLYPL